METWKVLEAFGKAARAKGWSPITINGYKGRLLLFFKAIGKTRIEEITPADLRKYAELVSDKKIDNYNLLITPIKSLFKWAYRQDLIEHNIGEKIDLRKPRERQIEDFVWLVNGEISQLLAACDSPRQTLMCKFFLKTGMRVGRSKPQREFCGLGWDDFNFEQRTIKVHGKGRGIEGKIRFAHFDTELSDLLKEWRDEHRGGMPVYKDPGTVAIRVRGIARKAGITKLVEAEHPVHALKHSFCTNWILSRRKANLPEDLRGLSAQVGTGIKTLEVYVHIAGEFLKPSYDETMRLQNKEVG